MEGCQKTACKQPKSSNEWLLAHIRQLSEMINLTISRREHSSLRSLLIVIANAETKANRVLELTLKAGIKRRQLGGFSLFAAWLVLVPRTTIVSSIIVYEHTLALGGIFLVSLAVVAVLDGIRKGAERNAALTAWSIIASVAGLAFLALPGSEARLACFGLEMAAGARLLLHWGRILSAGSIQHLLASGAGALASIALFYFFIQAFASALSTAGNLQILSDLMLGVLALLPLLSLAIGWSPEDESLAHDKTIGLTTPRFVSYILILCLASLLTSFMSGFTYLPYHFDWSAAATLRSAILLAATLIVSVLIRLKHVWKPWYINAFLLFSLVLTIVGMSLLTIGDARASFSGRGMLDAAQDCYFVIAVVLLSSLAGSGSLPFFPSFALCMAGTGLHWGHSLGIAAKRLLGYDPQILAPICTACIALMAVAFFASFSRNLTADRIPKTLSVTPGEEASPDSTSETTSEPVLDAASAMQVIEQTNKEILAPYQLSPRETQVALMMIEGYTAAAAAEQLGISIATVKFHLGNGYRKMGIQSKTELIHLAKQGLPTQGDNDQHSCDERKGSTTPHKASRPVFGDFSNSCEGDRHEK